MIPQLAIASIAAWQVLVMKAHHDEKTAKYATARAYCDEVGKPLLIIGGPWAKSQWRRNLNIPAHGFGDYCLDINPESCEGAPEVIEANIHDIPFPNKFFGAVLASHVLEHLDTVDDCLRAINELNRVADLVFICVPSKQSIPAWLHREHHLWVSQKGDTISVEQRNWPRGHLGG